MISAIDFDIVNFRFFVSAGDGPHFTSYGVYISQLLDLLVSSHLVDFNAHNKILTAKLVKQGYGYHKVRKTFIKYRQHYKCKKD